MRVLRPSAVLLLLLLACRTAAPVPSSQDLPPCPPFAAFERDWSRSPAVVALDSFRGRLFVVGDVHGMLAEFQESLLRAGLVVREGSGFAWSGGDALLIQVGDLVNKGPHSLAAIDFVEDLAGKAQAVGGRVLVLAGNHEIGTLAKGHLRFYAPIREEAVARGLDLCRDVLDPRSRYGAWLRTRPAAAFVNGIYVSHSGNSQGRTREDVEAFYREMVDRADWSSRQGCGDAKARPPIAGFFNHDVWWGSRGEHFEAGRRALGVRQFLFGNDPTRSSRRGRSWAASRRATAGRW